MPGIRTNQSHFYSIFHRLNAIQGSSENKAICARAMVLCSYCRKHSSTRLRACICCRAEALPSCRPQRCMILAGLTSIQGLDRNRPIQSRIVRRETGTGWTLCCWCLRERLAAMLLNRAIRNCPGGNTCACYGKMWKYYLIADIISHYCGGPWTKALSWFYWNTYQEYYQLNTWKSNEGEEPQEEPSKPTRMRR